MPYEILEPQGRYEILPPEEQSFGGKVKQGAGNLLAGAIRGAGSIGATALAPIDMAMDALDGKGLSLESNKQRRAAMDATLQDFGADPDSWLYKGGKLATEVAGTAGAGGLLANGVRALGGIRAASGLEPIIDGVARGLETGGFRIGPLAGTSVAIPTRLATGAATGAASAGLANPSDAGAGGVVGAAFPVGVKGAGALFDGAAAGLRSAAGSVAPEVRQLAQRAEALGIPVPADRLVNSRPLNAVAAGLNYVPFSGRAATEDAMNASLNRAVSRTFGQDSPNVTMALRKADDVLGGQFDAFLRNNTVTVDRQFLEDLADVSNQATRELGADGANVIRNQVDEIVSKAGTGQIDGQAAYNIKRTLDRIGKRNSPEAAYALDLKGRLMDALNRSVGPEQATAFKGLRQQYGNMLSMQKLAKNGAEGEVSVARLANLKNIRSPQLQEIADIAAQFIKPRESQHGAAQRALVGGVGAYLGGLPGLAAGAAVGRATNIALNSAPVRGLLMDAPTGRLLGEPQALGLLTQGAYRSAPLLLGQD